MGFWSHKFKYTTVTLRLIMILCSSVISVFLQCENPVSEYAISPLTGLCEDMDIKNDTKPFKRRKLSILDEPSRHWLPIEILQLIFSYTNHASLRVGFLVSKHWLVALQETMVVKSIIYRTEAFGNTRWASCGGHKIVMHEDMSEEFKSLCLFIDDIWKKVFFGKRMVNILGKGLFLRIPKDLSPENIGTLISPFFPESEDGYQFFYPPSEQQFHESYWIWVSGNEIIESRGKCYPVQQDIAAERGYQDCRVIEVVAWLFAEFIRSGKRLCNNVWVRCIDKRGVFQSTVGFGGSGIVLSSDCPYSDDNSFVVLELLRSPAKIQSSALVT